MELTALQRFFLISGVGFWFIIAILIIGFISYLIVKPIPEPKSNTLDLTGIDFTTYDNNAKIKQNGHELRQLRRNKREYNA